MERDCLLRYAIRCTNPDNNSTPSANTQMQINANITAHAAPAINSPIAAIILLFRLIFFHLAELGLQLLMLIYHHDAAILGAVISATYAAVVLMIVSLMQMQAQHLNRLVAILAHAHIAEIAQLAGVIDTAIVLLLHLVR